MQCFIQSQASLWQAISVGGGLRCRLRFGVLVLTCSVNTGNWDTQVIDKRLMRSLACELSGIIHLKIIENRLHKNCFPVFKVQFSWLWLWEASAGTAHSSKSCHSPKAHTLSLLLTPHLPPPTPWTLSFMALTMQRANALFTNPCPGPNWKLFESRVCWQSAVLPAARSVPGS